MKYATLFLLCLLTIRFFAQLDLPNASFENWSDELLWSDPIPFTTLNVSSYFNNGAASTVQSTAAHSGNYCALMQSQGMIGSASIGAVTLGDPIGVGFNNPIAFNGRPDSLEFWLNYDIADGDQATIIIMLLLDGVQVGNALSTINGSSEDYVRFSSPLAYLTDDIPNQMGFAAFCTSEIILDPNSFMFLDDVSVIYNNEPGDQIPGGDFELWNDNNVNNPDSWFSSNTYTLPNASVTSSTDSYSGLSARIEAQPVFFEEGTNFGFVVLKDLFSDECGAGSLPTGNIFIPFLVTGYYKFQPAKGFEDDSASVYFSYDYFDENTESCEIRLEWIGLLPPSAQWIPFSVQLPYELYNQWCFSELMPDYFALGFAPSHIDLDTGPNSPMGSVLYIDELQLSSELCWPVIENEAISIKLFPNPVSDLLTIQNIPVSNGNVLEIRDVTGRLCKSLRCSSSSKSIDVSDLQKGHYFIKIINENGAASKSFIKID